MELKQHNRVEDGDRFEMTYIMLNTDLETYLFIKFFFKTFMYVILYPKENQIQIEA